MARFPPVAVVVPVRVLIPFADLARLAPIVSLN